MNQVINPNRLAAPGSDPDAALAQLVPYLHCVMSEPRAAGIAKAAVAMTGGALPRSWDHYWQAAEKAYPAHLRPKELEYYELCTGHARDAFRICRDLALGDAGIVFMSEHQLQMRVANLTNGWRVLTWLCRWGILGVEEKGLKWQTGQRPTATTYRWLPADFSAEPTRKNRAKPGPN